MQPANTFAILSVAVLLSACGTNFLPWQSGTPATSDGTKKNGIEEVALQVPATTRPTTPKPASPPLKIDDDPKKLVGLSPGKLADRLGSPGFVRRDGSAEIWQYLAEACILDVFLYRDKDVLAVNYVELRGRGASQLSRRDCYREMLRAHLTAERG
ncbi:MAG: hypothetical protein HOK54_24915 [Alphaproteobacteria bacterium]|jgi:hypothetical protein|nr:hypothetical protein [Alphaproteobacteria bacterium]